MSAFVSRNTMKFRSNWLVTVWSTIDSRSSGCCFDPVVVEGFMSFGSSSGSDDLMWSYHFVRCILKCSMMALFFFHCEPDRLIKYGQFCNSFIACWCQLRLGVSGYWPPSYGHGTPGPQKPIDSLKWPPRRADYVFVDLSHVFGW